MGKKAMVIVIPAKEVVARQVPQEGKKLTVYYHLSDKKEEIEVRHVLKVDAQTWIVNTTYVVHTI